MSKDLAVIRQAESLTQMFAAKKLPSEEAFIIESYAAQVYDAGNEGRWKDVVGLVSTARNEARNRLEVRFQGTLTSSESKALYAYYDTLDEAAREAVANIDRQKLLLGIGISVGAVALIGLLYLVVRSPRQA